MQVAERFKRAPARPLRATSLTARLKHCSFKIER
jgi:hypothetical protein